MDRSRQVELGDGGDVLRRDVVDGGFLRGGSGGTWLLRVERVSYDVVLDRFPWGLGWVKLPWMEAPLYVEW